ncbi:MAG: DNA mismatch repair endonuclease MutL [Holophagales bacterium]|nr:DNA mismatch repair endonuclease MutL [Holophagales bacterium]
MARIAVLPDVLVDQIAAGEVVERPASVVKELVENALDAGAARVDVQIEGGGIARLSVSDDGSGMDPEDARMALERHATSKVRTAEDLGRIGSLGFRGEALPSIASVSRLVLTTSPDGSGLGTEVVADRGAEPGVRPVRQTKGTRVVVEDLFGNVPARRKFLKSQDAEQRAIVKILTALALSRPEVAFTLRAGERELLALPAAPSALDRFVEVMGRGSIPGALPVSFSHAGMRLDGAVSPPETTFASRTFQWLYVNGRAARDGSVAHAARLAAEEALLGERNPAWVLFVTCPPGKVDPNVHPQKSEVRFLEPSSVHSLVHRGLREALTEGKSATALPASVLSEPFARPASWGDAPPPRRRSPRRSACGMSREVSGVPGPRAPRPRPSPPIRPTPRGRPLRPRRPSPRRPGSSGCWASTASRTSWPKGPRGSSSSTSTSRTKGSVSSGSATGWRGRGSPRRRS